MAVERDGDGSLRIHHGRMLIAEATSSPGSPALEIPAPVSMTEAHAVAGCSRYYTDPVFPDCFVCGMGRGPGDGLRIFAGLLAGRLLRRRRGHRTCRSDVIPARFVRLVVAHAGFVMVGVCAGLPDYGYVLACRC